MRKRCTAVMKHRISVKARKNHFAKIVPNHLSVPQGHHSNRIVNPDERQCFIEIGGIDGILGDALRAIGREITKPSHQNFPGGRAASEIWGDNNQVQSPNMKLAQVPSSAGETCGALAIETAGKAVSISFIGAMASETVLGELIRAFHNGPRFDEHFLAPRNMGDCD